MVEPTVDEITADITMGEDRLKAAFDEIVVDNTSVPTASVQATDLSRFEGRVVFGAYDKDSDSTMSSWIQDGWYGGALISDHSEGATDQRFRWSKGMWTLHAGQLALAPKMDSSTRFLGAAPTPVGYDGPLSMPLAEWNERVYLAFHDQLAYYSNPASGDHRVFANLVKTTVGTLLAAPPVNTAAVYTDTTGTSSMWIPLGAAGIQQITGTATVTAVDATIEAVAVKVWDKKLYALTTDGYLRTYTTALGWSATSEDMRVDPGETPRELEVFYDRAGNQTIFIATDKRMWVLDPDTPKVLPTSMGYVRDSRNALGFAAWRDDAIYMSSGLSVGRYSRDGVKTEVGLDRDDGVDLGAIRDSSTSAIFDYTEWDHLTPHHRSFTIGGLAGSINGILAAFNLGESVNLSGGGTGAHYSLNTLAIWNEAGWHPLSTYVMGATEDHITTPSKVLVTERVGGYRVWIGSHMTLFDSAGTAQYDDNAVIWTMALPKDFHAPRANVNKITDRFTSSGSLYTGFFDAGMQGFHKTFSHLELNIEDVQDGAPAFTITVSYRTEEGADWTTLGSVTTYGRNVLAFGEDAEGFPRGVTAQKIELKISIESSDTSKTPIINSTVLKFIKLPLPGRAWQITVPLDAENQRGLGPEELDNYLAALTYNGGFTKFLHGGSDARPRRIRVAQHQMQEGSGEFPFKHVQLNLVEVPIPGDPDWSGGYE